MREGHAVPVPMVNLIRNLGGSIGISAVTTLVAQRQQVHQHYLARNTYEYNPQFQSLLGQMCAHFGERSGEAQAHLQALRSIYATVQQQAKVVAYIDTFWITGTVCLLATGLLFFARKAKPGQAPAGH